MDFRNKGFSSRSFQIWDEFIEKENELRLKWNKSYDKITTMFPNPEELGWKGKYDYLEYEKYMNKHKFRLPQLPEKPKKADYTKEINEYLVKLGVKDEKSLKLLPITMYEQKKEEKDLIYNGISRDHEGRYKYLHERKKYKPEQKYPFPMTSSMNIGWKTYDDNNKVSSRTESEFDSESFVAKSLQDFPTNKYGIRNEVQNEFHRRNGVLSDQWKDDVIRARHS